MTSITRLTSLVAALVLMALTLTTVQDSARAEATFRTLAGIEAVPLTAVEMESAQGSGIINGFDPFTGRIETCVLGGLSCSGQATFTSGTRGLSASTFNVNLSPLYAYFSNPYQPMFTGFGVTSLINSWADSFYWR